MLKHGLALIITVLMLSSFGIGCTPARKPVPNTPTPNQTAPKMVPQPRTPNAKVAMPTTSPEVHKLATKLAAEAAKVKGVKKATVALTNNMAYVGIDLSPDMKGKDTNAIKKAVADRVKKADKRLTNVYVTSDVAIVARITKVAEGIGKGKPVSGFANELKEIGRRINPTTAK